MLFLEFIEIHSTILDEELKEFIKTHGYTQELVNYMDMFLHAYSISFTDQHNDNYDILADTFSSCVLIFYKHVKNNTGWAPSSFKEYFSVVRKILELISYLIHINDDELNEIYFTNYNPHKEKNYYEYLVKLSKKNVYFEIIEGIIVDNKKTKLKHILLKKFDSKTVEGKYTYRPVGNHILTAITNIYQNHMEFYFKTKDINENSIWRIFNLTSSKGNERKSVGGFKGKSIALEIYDIVNYIPPKNLGFKEVDSLETQHELSSMSDKEVLSPLLSEETAKNVNSTFSNDLKNKTIESPYKQFLINKAISNSYINKSLDFRNDNTKPSLPKLRNFLKHLIDSIEDELFVPIVLFSILLGCSIEKIIYSILNLDDDLKYNRTKTISTLTINIRKEIFSEFLDMKKNKLSMETSQHGQINFIDGFERKWLAVKNRLEVHIISEMSNLEAQDNLIELAKQHFNNELPFSEAKLKNYIETCVTFRNFEEIEKDVEQKFDKKFISKVEEINFTEYYINKWIENKKIIFTKIKKRYNKTIELNFKNIGVLFLYYYRIYNPNKNEFSILLTQNISKNDETRLKYSCMPKRLVEYENWIYRLTSHLNLDHYFNGVSNYIPQNIDYYKRIGSNNFVSPGIFKNFIIEINRLNFDDKIICFNICMIYLRYMFSIQLVSRDIIESSSNLSQVSKRFNLLTIHEKSQTVNAGKKILPLTQQALDNINSFYLLKKEFNFESFYPILLLKNGDFYEEIPVTRKNTDAYLTNLNSEFPNTISSNVLTFVKHTKLNFGRHIVTSIMQERGIRTSYIDACMSHVVLGREDQGMYSLFRNLEYANVMKEVMLEIEQSYSPFELTVRDFLWNLKV
jgi:hypothetical protein